MIFFLQTRAINILSKSNVCKEMARGYISFLTITSKHTKLHAVAISEKVKGLT